MHTKKPDISTRADIELMVNTFYASVHEDEQLSIIFNDFAKVDWDAHLSQMYNFWNNLIFSDQSYKGNPFAAHLPLPIDQTHFKRWLLLFEGTVDHLFSGDVAAHTKLRARSIAHIFQRKLAFIKQID